MRPEDDQNTRMLIRYGLKDVFVQASSYRSDGPQRELYVAEGIVAVLAALREAGALMPDLPDNWWSIELYKSLDGETPRHDDEAAIPKDHVYADYWSDGDDPIMGSGHGPTIPAAIANALEADHE